MNLNSRKLVHAIMILLLLLTSIFSAATYATTVHAKGKMDAQAFHDGMRKLWEDHITWTRLYIVSAASDLPDKGLTAQRLLQNQVDIGNAIKPFYGDAAGNQLTALLRDHILLAAQLIDAAKSGNKAAFADANQRWYANANDIADF